MVVGTSVGGLLLYDMMDASTLSDFVAGVGEDDGSLPPEERIQFKTACFITDSLTETGHTGAVVDLQMANTVAGAQIASLD